MHKTAFVLGGADTLREDLSKALDLVKPDTYITTNHAGRDLEGEVPHWVTLHTEKMPIWMAERKEKGLPDASQLWTSNTKTIPEEHKHLYKHVPTWDGSSGLLAITVAFYLGYERVILCGVPLDKKANHYDDDNPWMDAPRYRSAWTKRLHIIKGRVKSFSGWTNLILGVPTGDWLKET